MFMTRTQGRIKLTLKRPLKASSDADNSQFGGQKNGQFNYIPVPYSSPMLQLKLLPFISIMVDYSMTRVDSVVLSLDSAA